MNTDLNQYTIFYAEKCRTLREQLAGKVLAEPEILTLILRMAQGLRASEILKLFPEDWRRFKDNRREDVYLLSDVTPDPKPTYDHSVPSDIPGLIVKGFICWTREDSFSGEKNGLAGVSPTQVNIRTTHDSILDIDGDSRAHYNTWHPWWGILIKK